MFHFSECLKDEISNYKNTDSKKDMKSINNNQDNTKILNNNTNVGTNNQISFSQDFLLVIDENGLYSINAGGLIGLGFKYLLSHTSNLFIDNLYNNKIINDRRFLFDIRSEREEKKSNLIFGSLDIESYLGQVQYENLIKNNFNVFP